MSRIKELITEDAVHERKIQVKSYPATEGRLVVEGTLRDERFVPGYHWDGNSREAGVVHHMIVRLLIGGLPLTIEDAEAEMPGVPQELCRQTRDSIRKIIGVPIVSGYSDEVRKRLGGVSGCTHLTHLVVVMGPAALHGFWTHAARKPRPVPRSPEEIPGLPYLLNSCMLWAEDGPFMASIREKLKNA